MTCPHTDRPNVLSLPAIGNPHCCRECWDAQNARYTPYKGKREAWDRPGDDYHDYGDAGIAYRMPEGFRTAYKGDK